MYLEEVQSFHCWCVRELQSASLLKRKINVLGTIYNYTETESERKKRPLFNSLEIVKFATEKKCICSFFFYYFISVAQNDFDDNQYLQLVLETSYFKPPCIKAPTSLAFVCSETRSI